MTQQAQVLEEGRGTFLMISTSKIVRLVRVDCSMMKHYRRPQIILYIQLCSMLLKAFTSFPLSLQEHPASCVLRLLALRRFNRITLTIAPPI